ncbi:MAG TPA: Fe-S cluster assembly protein SufD [Jatrophihabitantaceae bacterium]
MTATLTHSHNGRSGSPPERFTSLDPDAFPVPTGREEEWRFTPVRKLRELFEPLEPTTRINSDVDAPDGVVWAIEPRTPAGALAPADRVSALALERAPQSLVVRVPPRAKLDAPVRIQGHVDPGTAYEHLVIEVGEQAQATVVVDYAGSATIAENVEILVGDGASLEFVSVQGWDADAIHLSAHAAQLGRDAHLKHVVVNLGGAIVRLSPTVRFTGPGARADLLGVSFAGAGQHHESRLYIDHDRPDCTSDVLYKNALQGEGARTVWIGDVRIRPAATGTSTFELNRNLVLTDGARADSVPNLEIETGEIRGAGHASATGRFDDLQLFYLQSRGIPEDEARRLVVRGFFADVIGRIGVPDLEERLMTAIEARLEIA